MSVSLRVDGTIRRQARHGRRGLHARHGAKPLEQPLIHLRASGRLWIVAGGSVIENVTRRDRSNPASTFVRL